ncbi:MAG: hypothetical protein V7764_12635, partial [Pseudomonas marincola]|uniref:hypothetical protein n=1 Tax=Pseudomonas marincola TaxID=437900 RepID=UPI003001FC7B
GGIRVFCQNLEVFFRVSLVTIYISLLGSLRQIWSSHTAPAYSSLCRRPALAQPNQGKNSRSDFALGNMTTAIEQLFAAVKQQTTVYKQGPLC